MNKTISVNPDVAEFGVQGCLINDKFWLLRVDAGSCCGAFGAATKSMASGHVSH